ncbi:GNAT family N-acetyltransferase [Echinimonas agarilytica]|uniref:GNAT family N-acetyltransferase n=1 Tax=Echinimonas agarilytica TaxID=1215918 RepID=A0AA41W498_9GAMM|nr:GNAT family N-acetyltransferase [Echinimonas agarilytica]MCM2678604.1 GNAT family N-acetyltransferase [Echinimonas agarilytica]
MVEVQKVDYQDAQQGADLVALLSAYACDPMGGGEDISEHVKLTLVKELASRPYAFSVLAYVDGKPAGFANCFEAFSTFAAQPLVNIHDLAVVPDYRGQQISQLLLDEVEAIARKKGCCKITLEVLSKNGPAKNAYQKFGFEAYQLQDGAGEALFWQKSLKEF